MRKLSTYFGVAILISIFVCGIIAYFVVSTSGDAQQWFDGFGRPLTESPWFMRVIFGEERLWAGWVWFIVDMIIFWGGLGIGFALISLGEDSEKT